MRELYICDTPYQLMNVLNIAMHKQDSAERTLFIVDQFRNARKLALNIEKTGLFRRVCVLLKEDARLLRRGTIRNIRSMLCWLLPMRFMKARFADGSMSEAQLAGTFDRVYASVLTRVVSAMLKLNPGAEFVIYDDGSGSYSGNVIRDTYSRLSLLFGRIFRVGAYVCRPSKLLVNNTEMCRSVAVPKDRIFPLPEIDGVFAALCREVFGVSRTEGRRVVWLSQPIDGVKGVAEARDITRSFLLPYRDKVTVRMHPRDNDAEFYRDFDVDNGNDMWELRLLELGDDADDLILIGAYSTAQINPKLLFGKEPTCVFLCNLNTEYPQGKLASINQNIDDLRKSYSNPEKIYVPKTTDELKSVLEKLSL